MRFSAAHLFTCLKNAVAFGIPEAEAIEAAAPTPAKALGADAEIGSLAPGKRADFVVCGEGLSPQKVF